MAYAAKLCNPTSWDVKLNYEKGVMIVVPAFGSVDLTTDQYQDYLPTKPGAEAVYEELDTVGVFLLDTDRPYENQALETLQKTRKKLNDLQVAKVKSYSDLAARQNVTVTQENRENVERQLGVTLLREKVATLDRFISKYESVVSKETSKRRNQFDPERTVFATNPPREFPSKVAREFFLAENKEIAEQEEKIREGMRRAENESSES